MNQQKPSIHGLMLNRLFAVLFLLSFFGNLTEISGTPLQVPDNQPCLKSNHTDDVPFHRAIDLPVGHLPGETPNENELEEEVDTDEDSKDCLLRSINAGIVRISTASSLLRCKLLFRNHPKVSLVILYHSWKVFLG